MSNGYWMLVLHSHLPFVKHPEYSYFLEEHWFYEAISETYIPLLQYMKKMEDEGIQFRFAVSVTPPLAEMMSDSMLMSRYEKHIEKMLELANKEIERTKDICFAHLAVMYKEKFESLRDFYYGFLNRSLIGGYRHFLERGYIDVITCGFTHGFLPLLNKTENAVRAQIELAVKSHDQKFGQPPKGIWLPECAYFEGLDKILADYGIRYFFVDTHGVLYAKPRPKYGVYAPVFTENGVAAFGRDYYSSKQVWSSKEGYPGDVNYRDFYRDIGYDLDHDYIKPYISPDGERVFTGMKYHRITGDTEYKEYYDHRIASSKTVDHAKHFVAEREGQLGEIASLIDRKPVVVSPYDAELYGHWWYEGPEFLYNVFKEMDKSDSIKAITPSEYLNEYQTNQMVSVNPSSWGDKGYYDVWLNKGNDWIYRHLHYMSEKMVDMAKFFQDEKDDFKVRCLNQMSRELFLAQSSDWAFLVTTGTAIDYAVQRTKEHIHNFLRLRDMVEDSNEDYSFLERLENKNSIFSQMDFRIYC
jgi:1,4-alpha-glucan branching enzyme